MVALFKDIGVIGVQWGHMEGNVGRGSRPGHAGSETTWDLEVMEFCYKTIPKQANEFIRRERGAFCPRAFLDFKT